jgi:hypothetical protein
MGVRAVKYLCLAYYDEKAFDAMSKPEFDAIVSKCLLTTRRSAAAVTWFSRPRLGLRERRPRYVPGTASPRSPTAFIETKEQVGGFFIIEARDLDEAIWWPRRIRRHTSASAWDGASRCDRLKDSSSRS